MSDNEASNTFVVVNDEAVALGISTEKKEESAPSSDKQPEKTPEKADGKADDKPADDPDGKKPDGEEGKDKETDKDAPDADDASEKRHQRRFEKRINRVTKRAKLAEERADSAEQRASKAERKLAELKAQNSKPKPEDFDRHEDYETALEKWTEGKKKPEEAPKQRKNPEFEEAFAEVTDSFEEGRKRHKDFDDLVLVDDLKITPPMVMAMADSDDPSEIAYYLGQHKDETARIAEMSPVRQAKEIAKIELKLSEEKGKDKPSDKANPAQPPKKVTTAPEPVKPVSGNDASEKKLEDMNFAEFEESRNKARSKSKFW